MTALEAHLKDCSVRQLIVAMRMMRTDKDTLGFDYSKLRKEDLVVRAVAMAGTLSPSKRDAVFVAMKAALGWKTEDLAGKKSSVSGFAALEKAFAKRKSDDSDPEAYVRGKSGPKHGPEQGGYADDGEQTDGKTREETNAESRAREKAEQEAKDAAAQAGREAGEQAGKESGREAGEKAAKDAVEAGMKAQSEEIMDRLSKTVFKIEVESEAEGDGKDGKGKKKRQLEGDKPRHNVFQEVCSAVNKGLNVLLVGPAGCGKTHLAQEIAYVLDLPFRFTGAVSSEYKLLGFVTAHGNLVRTEYREAYENGGVFLWDELDASSAQALLSFNAGLANGKQDFPDVVVNQHKSFRAIASANTYGNGADRMYIGRNQLDAASLDRFYVVNMDYDEQLEQSLYGRDEWVLYVQKARQAMRSLGGIRHVISMRAIQMGLKMKGTGVPRHDVEQACLWRHLQKDDVDKIKRAMK